MATAADHSHGASAAHGAAHGGAHGHADAHGHGAHVDTSGDKGAAFVGLIGGMVLLGALLYGMVTWTNSRYAGHEGGEKAAAAATH